MESTTSLVPTKPAITRAVRSQALDDLIMGTNSSSIVSKRSVERLYYPNEPPYFRYFVKKFQRRAPLINRGYWLRLRTIDVIVKQFLSRCTGPKIVINLGCGSDVLPWQSHVRYGNECEDALFIDIDYPDLMRKKRAIVLETPQLQGLLGPSFEVSQSDEDLVLLRSKQYCQIGCDLRELDALRKVLESLADLSNCPILFVAEVSVTYMDTESADNLLKWASSVGKAEFCLLEQLLPYGRGHPFAQTMLKHFEKLKTPPRSVAVYPTVSDQFKRFRSRGWSTVRIWDLWEAWSCDEFVKAEERVALDDVEPFDEWEEFMLFARHYFVLHASAAENTETMNRMPDMQTSKAQRGQELSIDFTTIPISRKRRFGAFATLQDVEGQKFALNMTGLGSNAREESYDVYSLDSRATSAPSLPLTGPSSRMCFTVTDLGSYGTLLVGGRGSPANALSDCWLLKNDHGWSWHSTWKLAAPLYRHSALRLPGTSLVLVAGGKTGRSQISKDYYVFSPEKGWLRCKIAGDVPKPSFGSILCNNPMSSSKSKHSGFICGGIDRSGLVVEEKYEWTLHTDYEQASIYIHWSEKQLTCKQPTITFTIMCGEFSPELSIFGAQTVDINGNTFICGGMGGDPSSDGQAMYCLSSSESKANIAKINRCSDDAATSPFMIGSSVLYHDGRIIIAGGGATCFSMGTFWETNVYQALVPAVLKSGRDRASDGLKPDKVHFIYSHRVVSSTSAQKSDSRVSRPDGETKISTIARLSLSSASEFESILQRGQPVVIENLHLGDCLKNWNADYMTDRVGGDKKVSSTTALIFDTSQKTLALLWPKLRRAIVCIYGHCQMTGRRSNQPNSKKTFPAWLQTSYCQKS
ncbi:leucine carboxyl methyltransferase 2 [Cordyceps javanica]|uniref:tRNA wybutosine-synthesizing protein 4 n=1 Tax=Cordyceps javanica TaxID=43265 RepID=A0A545UPC7_9HYPO|nr:leucine carboxyl methyltransferase 2 [Cordyceps javanica]